MTPGSHAINFYFLFLHPRRGEVAFILDVSGSHILRKCSRSLEQYSMSACFSSTQWPFSVKTASSPVVRLDTFYYRGLSHTLAFRPLVGWTTTHQQQQMQNAYQSYDQSSQQEPGMKAKFVDLISAVRTLMRSTFRPFLPSIMSKADFHLVPLIGVNVVVILYELAWGG